MKRLLPESYLMRWRLQNIKAEKLQELRLRIGRPLFMTYEGLERERSDVIVEKADVEQIFQWLCGYGVYAYQEEMTKGYITIQGGHRVGIGGQVLLDSNGQVKHIKYLNSLLIRVSQDRRGVSDDILGQVYEKEALQNTLILSPPGCGKTTLLRDLVRQASEGNAFGRGLNVSLIDEREELAAMYMGIQAMDVGKRTDIISGCRKAEAMEMCLRALAPQAVAVDEIYSEADLQAVKRLHGSGCVILATHHAYSLEEFREKPFGREVLQLKLFDRFVLLGRQEGRYMVLGVHDREGRIL